MREFTFRCRDGREWSFGWRDAKAEVHKELTWVKKEVRKEKNARLQSLQAEVLPLLKQSHQELSEVEWRKILAYFCVKQDGVNVLKPMANAFGISNSRLSNILRKNGLSVRLMKKELSMGGE